MMIDKDIENLLNCVSQGMHQAHSVAEEFIHNSAGYKNSVRQNLTVKKYRRCLIDDPRYSFLKFLLNIGIEYIEDINLEILEKYKNMLMNNLEIQTVRSYVTAVKQLLKYCINMEWIDSSLYMKYKLPKIKKKKEIKTVPDEVINLVINREWGTNTFTKSRNTLIVFLFLKHGLHPLEFPRLKVKHIKPFEDLVYLEIYGKRWAKREVMLDTDTINALKTYMIERAHHINKHKIKTDSVFLSQSSKGGDFIIRKEGVQAVIRRIKETLESEGCYWDLSTLNAQGLRRTAASKKYEAAEYMPIHHPEMTICGELGHSLGVSQNHYWKKSLKNKYLMSKGMEMLNDSFKIKGITDE